MAFRSVHFVRYQIYEVEGLIELQTSSHSYEETAEFGGFNPTKVTKTCEVRPNIFINPKDERELFVTRKAADINQTDSYEMIVNAPRVRIEYDKKKEYCPKYKVTWYVLEQAHCFYHLHAV